MDMKIEAVERTRYLANDDDSSNAQDLSSLQAVEGSGVDRCQMPGYLGRHYPWAYLWRSAVWFFDHQPIINFILFGNYREIMEEVVAAIDAPNTGKTLQIASVYGELVPRLARDIEDLDVIDVAPIQLEAVARKLDQAGLSARLRRMNAESLEYPTGTFDTSIMFLLLHEMPPKSRAHALQESIRVLQQSGRLVIAEYGEKSAGHFIHRFSPLRWLLTQAEPFLESFWSDNLVDRVIEAGKVVGKEVQLETQTDVFGGFYRILSFRVD